MQTKIIDFEQRYNKKRDAYEDWVLIAPADDVLKTRTWKRILSIKPPEDGFEHSKDPVGTKMQAMKYVWEQIAPAYEHWKQGTELPETGTPLIAWSGLSSDAVKALQKASLKTIEQVAEAGDSIMSKVQWPNARRLPEQARKFLDSQDAAKAADALEASESRIRALEEQLAAMDKPKRGRPPKEKDEAA